MQDRYAGGARLIRLRNRADLRQQQIEDEAVLGQRRLTRFESGLKRPSRETLGRILDVLRAHLGAALRFEEEAELIRGFGYSVEYPLPSEDDRAHAAADVQATLDGCSFPVYLLDNAATLSAYNAAVLRLIGTEADSPLLQHLMSVPLWYAFFDKAGLATRMAPNEPAVTANIVALLYEMRRYTQEEWYEGMIREARIRFPAFYDLWLHIEAEGLPPVPARPLSALVISASEGGAPLRFWTCTEHLLNDSRFRVMYLIPANDRTHDYFS